MSGRGIRGRPPKRHFHSAAERSNYAVIAARVSLGGIR